MTETRGEYRTDAIPWPDAPPVQPGDDDPLVLAATIACNWLEYLRSECGVEDILTQAEFKQYQLDIERLDKALLTPQSECDILNSQERSRED